MADPLTPDERIRAAYHVLNDPDVTDGRARAEARRKLRPLLSDEGPGDALEALREEAERIEAESEPYEWGVGGPAIGHGVGFGRLLTLTPRRGDA